MLRYNHSVTGILWFRKGAEASLVTTKYASDYRLENVVDPRTGKLVTKAVYRGDWFRFSESAALIKRRRILFSVLYGLIVALFIGALLLTGIRERRTDVIALEQFYVMVPFAAMVFPVFYMGTALIRLWRAKDKVTREHRDRILNRFAATGIITAVLAGGSLIGHIVSWVLNGEMARDIVLLVFTAAIIGAAVTIFVRRVDFRMEQCGTARIAYPDENPEDVYNAGK